jgi:hypothetical protein
MRPIKLVLSLPLILLGFAFLWTALTFTWLSAKSGKLATWVMEP